jgi:membrane protein required for beta-lactamase induction
MTDFIKWLFDYRSEPVFAILFIAGCVFSVLMLLEVAFALYPLLGIVALFGLFGLFFGVPVVAYLMGRKKDD